jgi:hypothetical protein
VAVLGLGLLAGCVSQPGRERAAVERPPALLSAGVLELPADCTAEPGIVYRTEFLVDDSGAVDRVTHAEGPACVQVALADWVNTFRYAPRSTPAEATIDWMITVARK